MVSNRLWYRISRIMTGIVFLICLFPIHTAAAEKVIKIGILAKMGVAVCRDQWQPTAQYLADQINNQINNQVKNQGQGPDDRLTFEIVPLPYDQIYAAVKNKSVDFILANPSFYVELERWYGVNRIATLKNHCSSGACKTYGGVIFWVKSRTHIRDWPDLKGKRFMAANEFSLGGWRIVWRELKEHGIDPSRHFSRLDFGRTHEDVVESVLSGAVDIGSVRTDVLEQMAAEGKIRLNDFSVLNRNTSDNEDLPYLCSTRLYPEWPMAKLQSTSDDLAEKVTVALLQMRPESHAAVSAHCSGWTIPLNYQPVHECLRFLKLGPYKDLGKVTVKDVLRSYWHWMLIGVIMCIGSMVVVIAILRLNSRIRESHECLKEEMEEHRKTDKALEQAKEMAEAATRAKSEFLANMSHEIRTPMNGVIAATELIMNEPLPPKIKRYLKIIHTSAYSLLGLINDILDFSKIEAGKMSIESKPFMLDEILDRVVNLFHNSASEKGVELLVDIHPNTVRALVGDPLRLQQILTNLVGNAVKFTEEGGTILLSVQTADVSDTKVTLQFQVQDTGVGIPAPFMERLFQPFTQADGSDTRRYEGTGLGLSICKRLVEMMSGRIWVESKVNRGSTFSFTVQAGRQALEIPRKFDPPKEIRQIRVLVVDDSPESLLLVGRMLTSFGFEFDEAHSGREGVTKIQESIHNQQPFGLIIVDQCMPDMDGVDTVRQIQSVHSIDIPVIMMTAFGKEIEQETVEEIHVSCFLTKPIYPSTLYNAIMDIFGRKGSRPGIISEPVETDITVYKKRLQGFHILVVEDNPTNSEIAVAILESAGIIADTAENGRVALQKLQSRAYDAVLMDVQMPEMNGYEATRHIRQGFQMHQLPIIAMTAHAMRGDEEKCIQAGMDGYISKPVHQLRLFQLLWRLLKNRHPVFQSMTAPKISASPKISLPDQVEGLHIKDSLAVTQVTSDVYLKVLTGFSANHQNTGEDIKNALSAGDLDRIKFLSHTLKGSAANIGAVEVETAAEELESRLENHAPESEISTLCDRVASKLDIVLQSITRITTQTSGSSAVCPAKKPSVSDKKAYAAILERLTDALNHADPHASREILKELEGVLEGSVFRDLSRLVDGYDYEDAVAFTAGLMPDIENQDKRND